MKSSSTIEEVQEVGLDNSITVRCPRCGGRAIYDTPFIFYEKNDKRVQGETRPVHPVAGRYKWVAEKYPSIYPWSPSSKVRAAIGGTGVIKCAQCHLVKVHSLSWPADAYYKWEVKGRVLWARSYKHARVILGFLQSTTREPLDYGSFAADLRKLPREAISAKNRARIVKMLKDTLLRGKR